VRIAKVGVVGIGVIAALTISTPGFAGGNKYDPSTQTATCGTDGDKVALTGPATLWPPNHKFVDESVTATDGQGTEKATVTVTINPLDVSGGDGGAQHDPDWTPGTLHAEGTPSATVPFQLRSERSGKGDGRTYEVRWNATFDGGNKMCNWNDSGQSAFIVYVPHDMRNKAQYS
jgi:hypothetical protein